MVLPLANSKFEVSRYRDVKSSSSEIELVLKIPGYDLQTPSRHFRFKSVFVIQFLSSSTEACKLQSCTNVAGKYVKHKSKDRKNYEKGVSTPFSLSKLENGKKQPSVT